MLHVLIASLSFFCHLVLQIQRAEKSGYQALVLTVDTPFLGTREADVRNNFRMPAHLSLANFKVFQDRDIQEMNTKSKPQGNVSGLQKCK